MVISLSSDKAVWDAVMNNEVVRELRESVNEGSCKLKYLFFSRCYSFLDNLTV